jgi:hypothetical protein
MAFFLRQPHPQPLVDKMVFTDLRQPLEVAEAASDTALRTASPDKPPAARPSRKPSSLRTVGGVALPDVLTFGERMSSITQAPLESPRRLSVTFMSSESVTMSSTPSTPSDSTPVVDHLNLLVLLPTSAHMRHHPTPIAPITRPSPLHSRQSGSNLTTIQSLQMAPQSKRVEQTIEPKGMDVVMQTRRLSLGPGMGNGTQARSPKLGGLAPVVASPVSNPNSSTPTQASISEDYSTSQSSRFLRSSKALQFPSSSAESPPAFGEKRPPPGRGGRRRPQTAATYVAPVFAARGSIAVSSGMGLAIGTLGGAGKGRPGWEGDEVVSVLRTSGLEGELRGSHVWIVRGFPHQGTISGHGVFHHRRSPLPSNTHPCLSPRSCACSVPSDPQERPLFRPFLPLTVTPVSV